MLLNFCNRMGSVNLVIIVESARSIITHGNNDTNDFNISAVAAVAAALGKCCIRRLPRYENSRTYRDKISSILVLLFDPQTL
jgi:hypothetical protein